MGFAADLPVVAGYLLGYHNGMRDIEDFIQYAIDRPCGEATTALVKAQIFVGRATTARDQHLWHSDRIIKERLERPATRRRD